MVTRRIACLLALLGSAAPAAAAGWERPEWRARLEAVSSSDLFPGYLHTGADRGAQGEAEAATAVRLASALKLGLAARAGGVAYSRFGEARHGWAGAEASLRRGGARLVGEAEWTPRRVKFPSDPEDAAFERWEGRLGLRQSLPRGVRLRLEGRREHDDFVPAFDARDAITSTLHGRLEWKAGRGLTLRAEAEGATSDTRAAKHAYRERVVGGGGAWSGGAWALAALARSAIRRYPEAGPSESNYRRRDQRLELAAELARVFAHGLQLAAALEVRDQTSSRLDRAYTQTAFRLGLRWAGGGE